MPLNVTWEDCPDCGRNTMSIHLKRHRGSISCTKIQRVKGFLEPVLKRMADKGFTRLHHGAYRHTLHLGGVPLEKTAVWADWNPKTGLSTSEGWWAPEWANLIVSNRSTVTMRIAVLKACLKDSQKKDAIVAAMLLTTDVDWRAQFIRQIYKNWDLP